MCCLIFPGFFKYEVEKNNLFKIEIFSNIINVFTDTFQFWI